MSRDYPDDLDRPRAPAKPGRGCFFYGCLFATIITVVVVIAIAAAGYFGFRYIVNSAKEWTEETASPMPAVAMPAEGRDALHARVKAFGEAIDQGKAAEPLVLTADDVNALIDDEPRTKGKAHVDIEGDRVKAKVSIPAFDLIQFPGLEGRFLNAAATLRVAMLNGQLDVRCDSLEVKGKPAPDWLTTSVRGNNLAKNSNDDPKARSAFDKIDRLEVKDGTIIVTPRAPAKPDAAPKPDADPKPDETKPVPDDATKSEAPKDEPKPDAPKADETKAEAPKAETPKEEPKAEAPKHSASR